MPTTVGATACHRHTCILMGTGRTHQMPGKAVTCSWAEGATAGTGLGSEHRMLVELEACSTVIKIPPTYVSCVIGASIPTRHKQRVPVGIEHVHAAHTLEMGIVTEAFEDIHRFDPEALAVPVAGGKRVGWTSTVFFFLRVRVVPTHLRRCRSSASGRRGLGRGHAPCTESPGPGLAVKAQSSSNDQV